MIYEWISRGGRDLLRGPEPRRPGPDGGGAVIRQAPGKAGEVPGAQDLPVLLYGLKPAADLPDYGPLFPQAGAAADSRGLTRRLLPFGLRACGARHRRRTARALH